MNRAGGLAFGAAVVGIALLFARDVIWGGIFFFETSTPPMFALGLAGWTVATFGPLALSICCWRFVRRVHAKWVFHLLFIPCAITMARGGETLLFLAGAVPDGDGALGYTLLWAILLLVLTVSVHAAALTAEVITKFRRRANDS